MQILNILHLMNGKMFNLVSEELVQNLKSLVRKFRTYNILKDYLVRLVFRKD